MLSPSRVVLANEFLMSRPMPGIAKYARVMTPPEEACHVDADDRDQAEKSF